MASTVATGRARKGLQPVARGPPARATARSVRPPDKLLRSEPQSLERRVETAVLARCPRYAGMDYLMRIAGKEGVDRLATPDQLAAICRHLGFSAEEVEGAGVGNVAVDIAALGAALFSMQPRRRSRPPSKAAPLEPWKTPRYPIRVPGRCRTGVLAEGPLPAHGAREPTARLALEHVQGYSGESLWYCSVHEVVFYVAAVAVVMDTQSHAQRFYVGHTDDIKCLALDPAKAFAATGQVTDASGMPFVSVWDVRTMAEVARLQHSKGSNQVAAVAFSPDGRLLATVTCAAMQPICVWAWRERKLLRRMISGIQPTPRDDRGRVALSNLKGALWLDDRQLVTFGKNHLHFWHSPAAGTGPTRRAGVFNALHGDEDVLCACTLPNGQLVSGHRRGTVCAWSGAAEVVRTIKVHRAAVSQLVVHAPDELVSAGLDGKVVRWDAFTLTPLSEIDLPAAYADGCAPRIEALDCFPGSPWFVLGTDACDIWEVNQQGAPRVLVSGHSHPVAGLDANPVDPNMYCSVDVGDEGSPQGRRSRLFIWDAVRLEAAATRTIAGRATCVSWGSPTGANICVCLADGRVDVVRAETLSAVASARLPSEPSVARFSASGALLAVGSRSGRVFIMDFVEGRSASLRVRHVCHGHSSTVQHLDWAVDTPLVKSQDQSYEVLEWEASTGRRAPSRVRGWGSHTCVFGWGVLSIWPEGYDNTDINSVDRSKPEGGHVVAGDDFGRLLLFNHPCVVGGGGVAPFFAFPGHSSHICAVRFLHGGQRCVSGGGLDRAVMQWSVEQRASA